MIHYCPDLPGPERRTCLVDLWLPGSAYIARYNEVSQRWLVADNPNMYVAPGAVKRWAFVDEIFTANPRAQRRGLSVSVGAFAWAL